MRDTCEAPDCPDPATHTIDVTFPDLDSEHWRLCRDHDRLLKSDVTHGRPKKPPVVAPPARPNEVRCGTCGREIDQPSFTPVDERIPCPDCGSPTRWITAWLTDSVATHDSVSTRLRRSGSPGWAVKTVGGDSYTHDLEAWGRLGRTVDRENDVYREVIELWDGTRIESTASLANHQEGPAPQP